MRDDDADHGPEDVRRDRRRAASAAAARRSRGARHDLVGDRAQDGLELGHGEELKVGVGVTGTAALRAARTPDGVLRRPAAVDRVLEYGVHEREDVAHRLWCKAGI
ncbi:MAG TPA: hypothetical protein VJ838_12845 [Gaiellaceae bacterium]|nr:hypothetical protein [Gaiellaceae bacterium]